MKKERFYYIGIIVVVALFLVLSFFLDVDPLSKRITTTTTLIAAVAFWLQFKRTERLNESTYIMNLNNQFINNGSMTQIEHVLELYYNQYEARYSKHDKLAGNAATQELELVLDLSREGEDCQKLINYLVYLEALAALVERNVIHIDVIDNLFAYRFFLAVNNPVVQETELIPYKDYYQGIYWLSKEWTKRKNKRNESIPLKEFNLYDIGKNGYVNRNLIDNVIISKASEEDNFDDIAECIYDTDPYIYPAAFGEDKTEAIKAIKKIIDQKDSIFDLENIVVAKYNKHIIGVCVSYSKSVQWKTRELYKLVEKSLSKDNNFKYVSDNYFEKELEVKAGEAYILALCISKTLRGRGVSDILLDYVLNNYQGKIVSLEVLKTNTSAIELYKKHGFKKMGNAKPGFSMDENKPECFVMVRE